MMWKKAVIAATIVFAVVLAVISVNPSKVQRTEFSESAHYRLTETKEIPFVRSFEMSGFGITGAWEGPGYAQVWLVENRDRYLVFDTRLLMETIELSAYGTAFDAVCIETCELPGVKPTELFVLISGPGILSIDMLHYAVPLTPSGLAVKRVQAKEMPDHSMLVLVLLLLVAVLCSHTVSHFCTNPLTKRVLVFVFLGSFLILGGMFGITVAAPTTAIAATAKKTASVLAALAFLVVFVLIAIEMLVASRSRPPGLPNVWKELEEAEEGWEKK
ncbi:MAG: hypothetical protein QW165_03510 [Candidatus Woesearchaeota archaeon]